MGTVTVRGRAVADVEPDRVRLVLAVQAEAATAGEAVAALVGPSAALDAALDAADLLLRRPSAIALGPVWSQSGELTGQAARRVVTVEAAAAGPLGDLVMAVSVVPGGVVVQTEWLVDPTNPVHARLRGLVVADARQRAGDYATAAGLRLGAVEQIIEPGPAAGRSTGWVPQSADFRKSVSGGGGPVLELRPEPVPVEVEVDVRYALLTGPQG